MNAYPTGRTRCWRRGIHEVFGEDVAGILGPDKSRSTIPNPACIKTQERQAAPGVSTDTTTSDGSASRPLPAGQKPTTTPKLPIRTYDNLASRFFFLSSPARHAPAARDKKHSACHKEEKLEMLSVKRVTLSVCRGPDEETLQNRNSGPGKGQLCQNHGQWAGGELPPCP